MMSGTANSTVCSAIRPSITPKANQRWRRTRAGESIRSDDKGELLLRAFARFQRAHARQHVGAEAPHLAARGPAREDELADARALVLDQVLGHFVVAAHDAQCRPA